MVRDCLSLLNKRHYDYYDCAMKDYRLSRMQRGE